MNCSRCASAVSEEVEIVCDGCARGLLPPPDPGSDYAENAPAIQDGELWGAFLVIAILTVVFMSGWLLGARA